MQPHEQRVVDEKKQLDEKRAKLEAFIASNPAFEALDEEDRVLLFQQKFLMKAYSDVLEQRIARFK